MLYWGGGVDFDNRLNVIEANLDDLQAGVEACSRAANKIDGDAAKSNGLVRAPLHRSLLDHVKDLLTCLRDQHAVLGELRRSVIELRHEGSAQRPVRPPPDIRTAASRTR
jgi:hypothetical protein